MSALTDTLGRLPIPWWHRLTRAMGTYEGLHDWLGICPCQVDLDPGDEDLQTELDTELDTDEEAA